VVYYEVVSQYSCSVTEENHRLSQFFSSVFGKEFVTLSCFDINNKFLL
jgi:hypothetical protein